MIAQINAFTIHQATFDVGSQFDTNSTVRVTALVLPELIRMLPKKPITAKVNLPGFRLVDPDFSRPKKIELILGADVIDQVLQLLTKRVPRLTYRAKFNFRLVAYGCCR